ncbi:MAG: PA14 domain-containing protein, partial [Chloroflexota bacterium]
FHTYEGNPYSPVAFGFKYNASLYYYLVFLGYKAIGPGILAIRGVTALLGSLGVLAVYPLGRLLFGRRIALVAMFLLAVMRWHIDFSRLGMFNVTATVFASLALYFLVKALRTGRWSDFGWAGLTFGLGFHSYLGFQVLALVPVVLVLGHVLSQRGLHRELASKLSFCFVMVLVIFAPLGLFAVQSPQEFLFRNVQTSLFNEKKTNQERLAGLRSNVEKHLLMFNYRGDRNARHNLPNAPMLDPVTGGLFVLGVGQSLLRIREQRHLMLLTWVGAGLTAGIMTLTFEAPQGARTIVITPALALLAAVPLGMMWRSVEQVSTRWHKPAALAVGAALLAFAAYHNYDTYFERHMKSAEAFYEFSGRETAMGRYIAALDPNEVYCYLQSPGDRVIRILNYGRQNLRGFDPWRDLPLRQSVNRDAILLFEPWRVATPLSEFQRYYPRGAVETVKGPDGQVIFHAIRIKPEEVTSVWGLTRRHYPPESGSSEPVYTAVDRRLDVDWDRDTKFAGQPLNVVWEGTMFVPESGEYTLFIESRGAINLSIDGIDVLSRPDGEGVAEGKVSLPGGLHALELRLQVPSASGKTRLYWQPPKAAERQLIPAEHLSVVPLSSQGLRRQYFNNPSWSGLPDLVGVDQAINFRWHPLPVRGPQWTADWRGQLRIDREGKYTFFLQTNDFSSMSLDGQEVFATPSSGGHRFTVRLTPGQHDVLLRY